MGTFSAFRYEAGKEEEVMAATVKRTFGRYGGHGCHRQAQLEGVWC